VLEQKQSGPACLLASEEPLVADGPGVFLKPAMGDLKGRSTRGGLVSLGSQGIKFGVRVGSMMLLARLLSPEDFGLQGMVGAITGFMALFKDAGLSAVTVQREVISQEQVSTLFWVNVGIGALLAIGLLALSPAIASFYHEPRLRLVAALSAVAFLFNGLAVQHLALLQRQMRFMALALIEVISLVVSCGLAVVMAWVGYRYWALVGMVVAAPVVTFLCAVTALPWRPGRARRDCDLGAMLRFGGMLTCNSLVVYLGYNIEKILLGRFFGAPALGLYGRAYQLISIPSEQFSTAISSVAFPSLARLQSDPERLRRAFLKGYSIVLAFNIPTTVGCAVFAEEIVRFVLGPKWSEAVLIFRLLTPTIVVLSLINPMAWFLISSGRARQSLHMALILAPSLIVGVLLGLKFGPIGVALATSITMTLLVIPLIAYAIAGSNISGAHIWQSVRGPLVSGILAAIAGVGVKFALASTVPLVALLFLGVCVVFVAHFLSLIYLMGQKEVYLDLIKQILRKRSGDSAQ